MSSQKSKINMLILISMDERIGKVLNIIYAILSGTQVISSIIFIVTPSVLDLPAKILIFVAFSAAATFACWKLGYICYSFVLGPSIAFGLSFIP
jgi:hypothetical protein